MKSFLLAAGSVLLSAATDVVAAPTRAEVESRQALSDLHMQCASNLDGHCLGGTIGFWGEREGHCYCGLPQADANPLRYHTSCAKMLDGRCPEEEVGYLDENIGLCFCGPASNKMLISRAGPTTGDTLISRLLPQDLKFPTNIPLADWNAIQGTLLLLDETLESQSDLHEVCTGAKDYGIYGFKLEIFRKLCTPEIMMPIPNSEVAKALKRVWSALFIDSKLVKHQNDLDAACKEAQGTGAISSSLDRTWILSQLRCKDM